MDTEQIGYFVVVAFRLDTSKSVYYGKAKNLEELGEKVIWAFANRGAHFASVRFIKNARPDKG